MSNQSTLGHTGAGTYQNWSGSGRASYDGSAGTCDQTGEGTASGGQAGNATWAMDSLAAYVKSIASIDAKLSGYYEPEGGDSSANIYAHDGDGWYEDATANWPLSDGYGGPGISTYTYSNVPTPSSVANWNSNGQVGIKAIAGSSGRTDRVAHWEDPTAVITWYAYPPAFRAGVVQMLGPFLFFAARTVLSREWTAIRWMLSQRHLTRRGFGADRIDAETWAGFLRAVREDRQPAYFDLRAMSRGLP